MESIDFYWGIRRIVYQTRYLKEPKDFQHSQNVLQIVRSRPWSPLKKLVDESFKLEKYENVFKKKTLSTVLWFYKPIMRLMSLTYQTNRENCINGSELKNKILNLAQLLHFKMSV